MEVKQSNGINHNGNGYHTSGKDDDATNAGMMNIFVHILNHEIY